ncbi:OmpA family protein [Gluconobacter oxydans]|uniref:OmpA family protein n=1 Tax=Gluconobacter oxydans TaxID=442 RepID=UPI001CD90A66|nr:OmpA family protein [Gluconobacter oxydans]
MARFLSFVRIAAPVFVLSAALAGCAEQPSRDSYVVFFDRESVTLSPVAQAVVTKAATAARTEHASVVRVSGSAGTNGDAAVLKELATSRAQTVATQLSNDGLNGARIEMTPYVPSELEDSHVALRRVSITIVPGH